MKTALSVVMALVLAGLLLFFALAPAQIERGMNVIQPGPEPEISDAARALHSELFIGDLHSDSTLWRRDLTQASDRGHVDLPRLVAGNVALQVFTSVTKSPSGQNYERNATDTSDNITLLAIAQRWPPATWSSLTERALYQAHKLHILAEEHPEKVQLVRNRTELARLLARREAGETVVGGILGTEGGHALDGELANIQVLYDAGLRVVGLQHFFDNKLGGSLHGETGDGLSEFGQQAVDAMLALDMIIDVAHSSEAVVRDVLARSDKPVIVSHTGFQGHCNTPRNISDALMVEIADAGGIVGVGYWDAAVCDTSVAAIVDGIRYGIDLIGEDHVALGSDYDGTIAAPFDTSQLILLTAEMLNRGFTETEIRKVMGLNMLRILQDGLPVE